MLAQVQNRTRPAQVLYGLSFTKHYTREKPHWIYQLCTNIVAQIPPGDSPRILRVKNVTKEPNDNKLSIKQHANRVRVILEMRQKVLHISVHPTTEPVLDEPYKPRYSLQPVDQASFDVTDPKRYEECVRFCVKYLSQDTAYSRHDHPRIRITRSKDRATKNVFLAGRITSAFQHSPNAWDIGISVGLDRPEIRVSCDSKTLAGPTPCVDYYLVYADRFRAEVLTEHDFHRYYAWIDE